MIADSEYTGTAIAPIVPDTVQKSIADSSVSPEAAANPEAVSEKKAVEGELLKNISPAEGSGAPAPTDSAALAATAPAATGESKAAETATTTSKAAPTPAAAPAAATTHPVKAVEPDSRDVSPMSKPGQPSVTTGVGSSSTPTKSVASTSNAGSPASTDKKSKRASGFFHKLKSKFGDKEKGK